MSIAPARAMASLPCYFGHLVSREGWQVYPIPREQLYVSGAGICLELHITTSGSGRGRRTSTSGCAADRFPLPLLVGGGEVASSLQSSLPQGMPRRLLVVGIEGAGKTVLTKLFVVESCCARLQERHRSAVPFRFALVDLAPRLSEHDSG